jgi:transposase
MQTVSTVGLDIAKSVFQVHCVDGVGQVVIRRQLTRRYVLAFFQKLPPCLIGIEACASSHYWSRELQALGHTVRLMPAAYVKPYVKRQKNDATDAEAICEAVTRANMRFVETKTPEQQSCLMLHRTRHLLVRQQTAVINALRAHLAEFGIVAPLGRLGVEALLGVVADPKDQRVPEVARVFVLIGPPWERTLLVINIRECEIDHIQFLTVAYIVNQPPLETGCAEFPVRANGRLVCCRRACALKADFPFFGLTSSAS